MIDVSQKQLSVHATMVVYPEDHASTITLADFAGVRCREYQQEGTRPGFCRDKDHLDLAVGRGPEEELIRPEFVDVHGEASVDGDELFLVTRRTRSRSQCALRVVTIVVQVVASTHQNPLTNTRVFEGHTANNNSLAKSRE